MFTSHYWICFSFTVVVGHWIWRISMLSHNPRYLAEPMGLTKLGSVFKGEPGLLLLNCWCKIYELKCYIFLGHMAQNKLVKFYEIYLCIAIFLQTPVFCFGRTLFIAFVCVYAQCSNEQTEIVCTYVLCISSLLILAFSVIIQSVCDCLLKS